MDAISSLEFDYVASGHYANVIHPSADQMDKPSVLELSKDPVLLLSDTFFRSDFFPLMFGIDIKYFYF